MTRSLVWLASYPKSGNTWVRVLLANYLFDLGKPISINQIQRLGTGDSVTSHYRAVAKGRFNPQDDAAMLRARGEVLRRLAGNGAQVNLIKTHNQCRRISQVELIPEQLSRAAIYIIRDPLDVIVSYAEHYAVSHSRAASELNEPGNSVLPGASTVRQYIGAWSGHVRSWTRRTGIPTTVIRYEDLSAATEEALCRILRALGTGVDEARVERAVRMSSFDELARQEQTDGFKERSDFGGRFFRSGKAGEGRKQLDQAVIDSFVEQNRELMEKFEYL